MKPFSWVRGAKKEGKIPAIVAGFVVSLALVSSGCSGLVSSATQPPPPPQLTISNAAVSSVSSTGATITWQTSAAANSQIEYGTTTSYGSMTALDSTVVTSHGESITGLSAGTLYHFRVHSTDANGNQATSGDMTFTTASGTPPTVSITSPTNGATVSGTISVVASASSSVGIASVQFLVDGANFGAPATASPYTVSLNTTALSNGNHTLAATAKDTAGNSATSASITVTVSNLPTPPPGSTVTSFQLTSPLGGTLPFTVGLAFKKGDVPTSAKLSIPNQQVITKRTWNDGSVKTAMASGRITLTANTPTTIDVTSGSFSGTNKTCTDIQTANPSASVQLGSIGTVNLSSLLASPFRTWVSGPEMVECHYRSNVGSDATLDVWFYVRLYADGRMWVRATVYNGYLDVNTAAKSYIPTVIVGGTTVYNNGGSALNMDADSAWSVTGWIGGDPQITPAHDVVYLEKQAKFVPNYLDYAPSQTVLNTGIHQTYLPMQIADLTPNMGDPGFQYQIGLLTRWDALWVTSRADSRAYRSVLANASALNSYPIIYHSSSSHLTPRPSDFPTWSCTGPPAPACAAGGGGNTTFAGTFIWDVAHHPSEGYLAYLITGDYWFYQTLLDQAAACYLINGS